MNAEGALVPDSSYDDLLEQNVRPPDWVNPEPAQSYNLVVIGAGTAGLVAAAGAAALGARVALVEKRFLGGDCLNNGCVPSKTIISSSRYSEEVKEAPGHGVRVPCGSDVDFPAVMERMRRVRADISSHDSALRFDKMGVDVFLGEGRFTGHNTAFVEGKKLRFKKALIATGARALHPPVDGLAEAGYLTNENVFSLTERPGRLAVLGGGAIGCELAQAFSRLGSKVTLLHNRARLMDKEDEDASKVLHDVFAREGISVVLGDWALKRVETSGPENAPVKLLVMEKGGETLHIEADEILVAVGRIPNVEGLDLGHAGVKYDRRGVVVDDYLRTTNPDIFAAGDICLKFKFTHTADAAARIVIANALFLGHRKVSALTIPWCTYTDPEVAHVGIYPEDAEAKGIAIKTFSCQMTEVDRALMEGELDGFLKVHVKDGTDEILGATMVSRHAGDMIGQLTLAMTAGIGMKTLSEVVNAYPTRTEAIKIVADKYNRTRLTPTLKGALIRWLNWTK